MCLGKSILGIVISKNYLALMDTTDKMVEEGS